MPPKIHTHTHTHTPHWALTLELGNIVAGWSSWWVTVSKTELDCGSLFPPLAALAHEMGRQGKGAQILPPVMAHVHCWITQSELKD